MNRRQLDFRWRLRQIMAAHEMWKTTDLQPLLRERGVKLSTSQVYRLVSDKPERISLPILLALCDIFDCTSEDLIDRYVDNEQTTAPSADAGEATARVHDLQPDKLRPRRARIIDD